MNNKTLSLPAKGAPPAAPAPPAPAADLLYRPPVPAALPSWPAPTFPEHARLEVTVACVKVAARAELENPARLVDKIAILCDYIVSGQKPQEDTAQSAPSPTP